MRSIHVFTKQSKQSNLTVLFMDKILIPQKVPLNLIVKIDETWTATWLQFFWILVVWESEFDFSRLFSFFFQYFIILEWYNIPFFLWPDVTFDLVSNPYAHSFHLKLFWKINSIIYIFIESGGFLKNIVACAKYMNFNSRLNTTSDIQNTKYIYMAFHFLPLF